MWWLLGNERDSAILDCFEGVSGSARHQFPRRAIDCLDDDAVDIRTDRDGGSRELFSRDLEIFLSDIWIDCRNLVSVLDGLDSSIMTTKEFIKQLNDEENIASGRFTGAIASIMLLPTFIVGLYGQNFVDLPETRWHYGYLYSWGLSVVLTVGQVWFFRRRRWL